MALTSRLVRPQSQELIHLTVLRTQRLAPHWMRITLGGGEIEKFRPMGYDQWFRIFLPLGGDEGLERIPAKANKIFGYLRYLRIPDGMRPVMRNYTVRAFRPATDGTTETDAELDVDFVLHGSAADGTAGPASRWAESCEPGESVVIIDEGLAFNPARGVDRVLLVVDETALPAVSGICASLPLSATGRAIIEVPTREDALDFPHPAGVEVEWIVRDEAAKPGASALARLEELTTDELPAPGYHAYIGGEQALPTGARRHLTTVRGVDKDLVSFCGYWRVGAASPTPKSQAAAAESHS